MITLHQLLKAAVKQGASDLHLLVGSAPVLRVNGSLVRVKSKALTADEVKQLCFTILTDEQRIEFEQRRDLDFSFGVKNLSRFRGNLFYQKNSVSAVFRKIPIEIPDINLLGLPPQILDVIHYKSGLVLVAGPTGCGKTTTIAGLIDKYNKEKRGHVITVEDPIEYIHSHKNSIINQREIGVDTPSYNDALRYILRQDPDVVLLGELRDLKSIQAAMLIAETGHLVFSTIHTNSAVQSISRIIREYPGDQQEKAQIQLSSHLRAIVSQRLVKSRESGRVVACEYMALTSNIQNLIRDGKLHQVYGMMQVGQEQTGMMTLNQSLLQLVLKRKIDVREAFEESADPDELDSLLTKAGV
ncbi:MAG: PilT/PilU family type 4a pilus ATPase [Bdellovibrionaceae bacterium]|jgi:twitching motility protein PilT|nr:PilT/PilU family type 4a pilus ATPase [Pseudobdellovibrionaceae bacterium]